METALIFMVSTPQWSGGEATPLARCCFVMGRRMTGAKKSVKLLYMDNLYKA
jgi:hypothetical protein